MEEVFDYFQEGEEEKCLFGREESIYYFGKRRCKKFGEGGSLDKHQPKIWIGLNLHTSTTLIVWLPMHGKEIAETSYHLVRWKSFIKGKGKRQNNPFGLSSLSSHHHHQIFSSITYTVRQPSSPMETSQHTGVEICWMAFINRLQSTSMVSNIS